jgi:hypothetical protein
MGRPLISIPGLTEQASALSRVLCFRFRDTLLSMGGSVPAREVFRRFRGRDPTPDLLVLEYGGSMSDDDDSDGGEEWNHPGC